VQIANHGNHQGKSLAFSRGRMFVEHLHPETKRTVPSVGESWRALSLVNKLFFAILMPAAREDHEAQEAAVKGSGLAWTITRPSGLKDTPHTGASLIRLVSLWRRNRSKKFRLLCTTWWWP